MKNRKKTIQSRLVLLLVMVLVPVIGIQAYMYYGAFKERKAAELRSNLEIARAVAKSFDTFVKDILRLELAVGFALTGSPGSNRKDENRILFRTREDNPELWEIFWVSPKGIVLSATGTQFLGMNLADREYFKEIVAGREYVISDLLLSRTTGKPSFTISRAIKDEKGLLLGVVTIGILPERLDKALGVERFKGGGFAVIDSKGILVYRYPAIESTWEERNWLKQYPQFGDALKGKEVSATVYAPFEGKNRMVGFAPIPSIGWAASAGQREEEVTGPILAAIGRNAAIAGLILAMAFFIAFSVARRLANPIMMLRQYALALGRGQGRQPLPAQSVSELNDLADAFNTMDENVRARETALQESEQRWATTLASIGDAVIATDVQGRIMFMNAVAEGMTGWTLQDASQKPVTEVFNIINEYTREAAKNPVSRVLREGQVVGLANHTVLISSDGREMAIDDSAAPIRDTAGNVTGVVLAFHDVTEKRKAEKALREMEENFRSLFQGSVDAVFMAIPGGSLTGANPAACTMFGMTEEEPCKAGRADIEDPDNPAPQWALEERARTGKVRYEAAHVRKDGSKFPTEVTSVILAGGARSIVFIRDITERKRAEDALRQSEARLRLAQQAALVGTFEWNLQNDRDMWTPELEALYGLHPGEFAQTGTAWAELIHPEDRAKAAQLSQQSIQTGEPTTGEWRVVWPDGSVHWLAGRWQTFKDASGQPLRMIGVNMDITERKLAEEALKRAHETLELRVQERTIELSEAYEKVQQEIREREHIEDQLRQSQKMEAVGTLAGGIAHDFNNILAAILGFAEMSLDDVPENTLLAKNLQNILKSSFRARDLIRQMLTFSRKTEYEIKPISLTPLINETAKLLRASIPTTVQIDVNTTATSDTVLANATGIQQIIMNLVTNAAYAMREDGGKLSITLDEKDSYVRLTVKDRGCGMDAKIQKRIFEPFFTTKEIGQGTGMGLAVVYGLIQSFKGEITVESTPGIGSTFTVLFPKAIADEASAPSEPVQLPTGNENVLFIDDEELIAELGKATLERLGYAVTTLTSSAHALKLFSQDPTMFDLVITDQTMPELTGMRLAERLLRIRPDLPIILCTGHSDSVNPESARAAGIKDFLMKPLAKQELAVAVRTVLDEKGSA